MADLGFSPAPEDAHVLRYAKGRGRRRDESRRLGAGYLEELEKSRPKNPFVEVTGAEDRAAEAGSEDA